MSAGTINEWKQAGALYLWRYTENQRNYPGWHLAADKTGFAALTDLLTRLLRAGDAASRTTQIAPPSPAVLGTANNRTAPVVSTERARWNVSAIEHEWRLDESSKVLSLNLGRQKVAGMLHWLSNPEQAFDTTYGTSPPLWFWGITQVAG